MKIKILIVEDEALIADDIAAAVRDMGFEVAGLADNHSAALELVRQLHPDIVLMDIKINGDKDGIETAKDIYKEKNLPIIYLTANSNKPIVERAIETQPHAFITKPFDEKDLQIAIELAMSNFNAQQISNSRSLNPILGDIVFLRNGNKFEKVRYTDIHYIEADGSYSMVHTSNGPYTLSVNLSAISENLDRHLFVRVHRSFIVNLKKVDSFDSHSVFVNGAIIPVSKTYQDDLYSLFKRI